MQKSLIFHWDPLKPCWNTLKTFLLLLLKGDYIIKPYSPPRNLDQNALYWVLLNWVAKETWNDSNHLHEMMWKKYLAGARRRVKIWKVTTYHSIVKSTTKLKEKQFSEFYQKVELFFLENWVAPLPPHTSAEYQNLLDNCHQY